MVIKEKLDGKRWGDRRTVTTALDCSLERENTTKDYGIQLEACCNYNYSERQFGVKGRLNITDMPNVWSSGNLGAFDNGVRVGEAGMEKIFGPTHYEWWMLNNGRMVVEENLTRRKEPDLCRNQMENNPSYMLGDLEGKVRDDTKINGRIQWL